MRRRGMRGWARYFSFAAGAIVLFGLAGNYARSQAAGNQPSISPSNQAANGEKPAEEVTRATLENGLRVVIVADKLAPVATTVVNYLVGSNETPPGFPGTAHAQEHMMFRGSPGLTTDQLAAIGTVMGGNFNANTRESITQYLFTVPSEDLDVALHIEAARMRDVL